MNIEPLIDGVWRGLSGSLTLAIGGTVAYIAWQQYRLGERKFKLDLYDRRFAIYEAAVEVISSVVMGGDEQLWQSINGFVKAYHEANFFFPKAEVDYLFEVNEKARRLRTLKMREKRPNNDNQDAIEHEVGMIEAWFSEQNRMITDRFKPFLKVERL